MRGLPTNVSAVFVVAAMLAAFCGEAIAQKAPPNAQHYDGSYYCVAEFTGGLAYDERLKSWKSARFRPSLKFVANFKYAGPHYIVDEAYTDDYFVTITGAGKDKADSCRGRDRSLEKVEFTRGAVVRGDCDTIFVRYIFSLKLKRFQATFEAGDYVIGNDNADSDTPYITGGTCTKIQ